MNTQFLKELIGLVEMFETQNNSREDYQLDDFIQWIKKGASMTKAAIPEAPANHHAAVEITKGLIFAYRYAKLRMKAGFADTRLANSDDFSYLAILAVRGPLSKMKLIELNVHEKASGFEVIKRLISQGFIRESSDEHDKRVKLVSLTPEGMALFQELVPVAMKIALEISEVLDGSEKQELLAMLGKLDQYHFPFYKDYISNRK